MKPYDFLVICLIVAFFAALSCAENRTETRQARVNAMSDLLACYGAKDAACFLDVGDRFVEQKRQQLLEQEQFEGRSNAESPASLSNSILRVFDEIKGICQEENFFGLFRTERNAKENAIEEGPNEVEEGRGKKKKKKGKLVPLIKLLVLGAVLKALITLKLKALSAVLQVKFFLVALAGLILNAARFYLDLKKGHQPQKVIYYEHAQHQHHYDGAEEDWSSGGSSSPGGGYWGRSYDEKEQNAAAAHGLAYAKQKPVAVVPAKSNSWFA